MTLCFPGLSGEHMGQKGNIWQMRRQLRRPSTPYGSEGRNEFCHGFEHGIWRRLKDFCLGLDQLPEAVCLIKFKRQLLILLVTAHNAELGATVCSLLLLQDECAIRCTEQAVCPRNHVEAVLGFHLARVMNYQQAHVVLVAERFEFGHDLIIAGVVVLVSAEFPNLLQRSESF